MTELRIDNKPVVLPENFSPELIVQNPVFTKNGSFTLEVDLSLDIPQNARLYSHLNRVNNTAAVPENRSAYLVVDNEVVLNGIEIILEISESKVKIQLASGESELNFLMGGDRKINDLDLGEIEPMPENAPGDREYETFPVYSTNLDRWMNIRNHPYFYVVVNKILETLGYAVRSNVFQTGGFRNLCIVNGIITKRYSRMLPDWTVKEFFEEIEKLFNVIFFLTSSLRHPKLI